MNTIWVYKGREFPFDVTEEYCYSLVSRGLGELRLSLDAESEGEFAKGCCDNVRRFFDTVFGEGAGKLICGSRRSTEEHVSAYISFISFLCSQVDEFSKLRVAVGAIS